LTIIMNRMLFSNQLGAGPPGGSGRMKGLALDYDERGSAKSTG